MTEPPTSFRERVRELLADREWSVRELARQTQRLDAKGVSHSQLAGTLRGKMPATERVMELVALALGISPNEFAEFRLGLIRELLNPRSQGVERALRYARAHRLI